VRDDFWASGYRFKLGSNFGAALVHFRNAPLGFACPFLPATNFSLCNRPPFPLLGNLLVQA